MPDWYAETVKAPTGSQGGTDWYREVVPIPDPISLPQVRQETAGAADISDVAIASLAEEPQAQIRWYSQQMGIPEERFGVVGGQIVYVTDDNKLQAVAPGVLREIAKGAGPSIPAVAGAAGTIGGMTIGAPTGPGAAATAAGGGMLGATAGQTIRDLAARQLVGQEMTPWRPVREAAYDFGATAAGLLLGKGMTRALASRAGKEINRLIKVEGRAAMDAVQEALETINRQHGTKIRLTPAEISNAAPLRAQQMALEGRPVTSQQLEDFYSTRAIETDRAMRGYLEGLSPSASPEAAGEALQQGAAKGLRAIEAARVAKGSPLYRRAFDEAGFVDLSPVVKHINEEMKWAGPALKRSLRTVKGLMYETYTNAEGKVVKEQIGDLEVIQNRVKETLDDEISVALRNGRNKVARRLMGVKDTLLERLDEASPQFAEARKLWGDLSDPVSRAQGGILPDLAGKTAKDFEYMGGRFLSKASPGEIGRARTAILCTEGGEDAWNATLKGYMGQRWEQAGRLFKSKIARPSLAKAAQPSAFWAEMIGNPEQAKRIKAAMSPQQWEAFRKLMKVFEATGRATNYNSTTAAQKEAQRMLDATGKGASLFKSAVNPFGVLRRGEEWITEMVTDANLRHLADVITTTDSVDELLKINVLNGARDRNIMLVAKAFNLARAVTTAGPEGTRLPGVPFEAAP